MANNLTLKSARDLLESRKNEITKALVNRIDPEAFIRVAHMAMSKNPQLLECTPSSLLMALLESASLGLMPNGVLGHAYIIPYRNKGVMEAQFQPGYRGLIDLARRSGEVKSVVPRTVNSNDVFEVEYGLDERLMHRPNLDDPGDMRFVYAVAQLTDGSNQFHIMPIRDVERIRSRSKAAKNGPWVTDYEAMAWKTVIKQLVKFLPLSLEVDQAVQQDNAIEFGGDMPVFSPTVPERPELPDPSRSQQIRSRIAPLSIEPPQPQTNGAPEEEAEVVDEGSDTEAATAEERERLNLEFFQAIKSAGWNDADRRAFQQRIHKEGRVSSPKCGEWSLQEFRIALDQIDRAKQEEARFGADADPFGEEG